MTSDGEAPTMEIRGMWSTLSLPLLPNPLWPGMVAPDWVLFMGQIEQTVCKQMINFKLWLLHSNTWNHSTLWKRTQVRLRMLSKKCVYKSYIYMCVCVYKQHLSLNNLQWLIYHKTSPDQTVLQPLRRCKGMADSWWKILGFNTLLYLKIKPICSG